MKPKLNVYQDYKAMSLAAAERVMALLSKKPTAVICLPSGSTPLGMFEILVSANQKGMTDFSQCVFIGLDEWVGFGAEDDGGCRNLLNKDFLKPIGLREDQIVFFDGKAIDPEEECMRINKIVAGLGGLDLIILGVGMNGHLALNEPGTPWDSYAHVSELENVTKEVGQKYFKRPTVISQGITVGIRHIMEAKTAILMASGSAKAPVIQRALAFPVTTAFPATALQNHMNAEFLLDAEAAKGIEH
ncbi:glucosamine-6-phosphate deaminase [Dyadobacter chenwenxiniae]|uniref:Glucosamine-6-phosphate deaminase n=1 Tax=Dyadobacter chenwenxiniae TaxID=2906456 RepID=A0A9X1PP13_9BACT|nr:glucosamine-6-phosphate deaminase [Dyadobacter chenwenxiniae]MCF0064897.1 glucosamine-6-phosphate deaminase [Dyadobacter chenwenxiniae]UON83019.1 glucosamine-6-phosphate deaminase [Dyadobacter chenwenxiniae]